MRTVLLIGGLDPSGCAGLAADLRAVEAHGLHAAPVAATLTAQNTRGVAAVRPVAPALLRAQVDAVLSDLDVAAVKIGLVAGAAAVDAVLAALAGLPVGVPVVVDPVLRASTGRSLLSAGARAALSGSLGARATLLTPNAEEAAALTGLPVPDPAAAEVAGRALLARGANAVLVKGGHFERGRGTDVLVTAAGVTRFPGRALVARHARGTGCTLASAIAARLAAGASLVDAVAGARGYVADALRSGRDLGGRAGPGPVGAAAGRVGRLHVLVDDPALAAAAAAGGADVVQYREKRPLGGRALVERARAVGAAAGRARLVVDDRVDVAAAAGAGGVHLGREDLDPAVARRVLGPAALVGATANSLAEVRAVIAAARPYIDYLGVGPVFGTRSKAEPAPTLGLEALAAIATEAAAVGLPVVAIGGIGPDQVADVFAAGAHGVAVLSGVCGAGDPRSATERYVRALGMS